MFDDIVAAILSVMGDYVQRIILDGSVARGDNTWDSDMDIAVLLNCELDLKYDTVVSIIDIDADHFMEHRRCLPFYVNIKKEGITLWTREAA